MILNCSSPVLHILTHSYTSVSVTLIKLNTKSHSYNSDSKLRHSCITKIYRFFLTNEGVFVYQTERMLREEAEADASLRAQFGARWNRTESSKLTDSFRANADKYRQIIDNAVRADSIVQQKYNQHKEVSHSTTLSHLFIPIFFYFTKSYYCHN